MKQMELYWTLLVFLGLIPGAMSLSSELDYLIITCTVAIILFIVVVTMGCVFFHCYALYSSCGYERIPEWEVKKRQAVRRLASSQASQQYLTPVIFNETDNASWVERWNDNQTEEKDAVIQLGPETEYVIETTLEDHVSAIEYQVPNGNIPDAVYSTLNKTSDTVNTPKGSTSAEDNTIDSTSLL